MALHDPALVREAVKKYGDKIAVGIDAKDGRVRGGGWLEDSDVHFVDLAKAMAEAGIELLEETAARVLGIERRRAQAHLGGEGDVHAL